jgi:23S rRNA G2069 N7-methylase RlmK/C1962 C5-methylase RlmI
MDSDTKITAQAELLFNRLSKRHKHLKKWARRINTDACRLYDRDIPEIPLVIDLYGDAVSGALYKRPYEKDEVEEERWLAAMADSTAEALGLKRELIFLKQRERQRGNSQYEKIGKSNIWREVHEGDLRFRVNLSDYLDTGLFLDARKRRSLLRAEAAGKKVLNLFAYTCSLSVCAAASGAREVDSVDLSNTYLDWGKVNFVLNGLDANNNSTSRFIREDVLTFLSKAKAKCFTWDIIILDPPSFSNSKKMQSDLDIRRDYHSLIKNCLALLNPEGKLWFSSNARGFHLINEEFSGFQIKDLGKETEDEDFKGKKLPACYKFIREELLCEKY